MIKKKIGIVTFWTSHSNYGQILQGYALQKYLEGKNCDVQIIRFDSALSRMKEIFVLIKKGQIINMLRYGNRRRFNDFKKNIEYSSQIYYTFRQLKNNYPRVDLLITGSDQVWAYMHNKERRNVYLLNFGKDIKKISYAASFGRDNLQDDELSDYKISLAQFQFIGVREVSGVSICKHIGFDRIKQVVDPVALISVDTWRNLEKLPNFANNQKRNVFIYFLSNENGDSLLGDLILQLRAKYNVYYTNSSDSRSIANCYPSINEWIAYIDKCDFVITDSFHCTLMAILFKTRFVTVARHGGESMNNRLYTLLGMTGLNDRYISINKVDLILKLIEDPSEIQYKSFFDKMIADSKSVLMGEIESI